MPARIEDKILDCSIYLYPSKREALDGEKSGGSGFLVGILSETGAGVYIYAVTNSHVIREAKSPIIRLNTVDDNLEIIECTEREWYHHPDGDDLAVCPLSLDMKKYKQTVLSTDMFITPEILAKEKIGVGDEVFMIGRFIGYDGKLRNTPTVRFGNMSIGTVEPIEHQRGHLQDSFLIETRSLSGYSGSPVFVHILPFSKRPGHKGWSVEAGPWLLGIDWGHKHFFQKVCDKNGRELEDEWTVPTNSGVTCVVPVWKLLELLNIKEFTEMRKKEDDKITEEQKKKVSDVSPSSHCVIVRLIFAAG
jgi:hypothetical protein